MYMQVYPITNIFSKPKVKSFFPASVGAEWGGGALDKENGNVIQILMVEVKAVWDC